MLPGLLIDGLLDTKLNFIVTALGVCAIMATTLVLLMRNRSIASPRQRRVIAFWIAIVAGVGVWTTHFVAMIGYRPDVALTYDLGITLVSILVGIVLVGGPVAASGFIEDRHATAVVGVCAGLGVAAMHLTGMSAIENCIASYDPMVLTIGGIIGCGCFVIALLQPDHSAGGQILRALAFVGGVCALHFIAMSSVRLDVFAPADGAFGVHDLSITVALLSLTVFTVAVNATFGHRRLLAERRAAMPADARL